MPPTEAIKKELSSLENKYFQLVWAAKKPPLDADAKVWEDYWKSTPIDIRAEAITRLRGVVDKYPAEYSGLKDPCGDNYWHGFNSGCLAAFRWMISAQDDGVDFANEEFPFLDT